MTLRPVTSQHEFDAMLAEATAGLVYHLLDDHPTDPDLRQITSFFAGFLLFSLPGTVTCMLCDEGFDPNTPGLRWSTLVIHADVREPTFAVAYGICRSCAAMNPTALRRDTVDALRLRFPGVKVRRSGADAASHA